jgi:Txe/YoeB family toxin of Txe-Axe toxin-antitoxin module
VVIDVGREKATDSEIVEALNEGDSMTAAAEQLGYSSLQSFSRRIGKSDAIVYRNKLVTTNDGENGILSLGSETLEELGVKPGEAYYEITEIEDGRMVVEFYEDRATLRDEYQQDEGDF